MRVSLSDEPVTPAESLRVVYTMIASPADDGGAGITPGLDPWECVEFITPLGDSGFNKVSRRLNLVT
jgi:anoctamin-10